MSAQPVALIRDAATAEQALQGDLPVMLWLANDQNAPTDIRKALETAQQTHQGKLLIGIVDIANAPALGERFSVGKHPVMVGGYAGEVIFRRQRPWATDVSELVDKLVKLAPKAITTSISQPQPNGKDKPMINKPVKVTDTTFQQEVIDSDLPVLIDFWAEWCGPCKMIAPALEKLAGEYAGKVKIAKVNVDENPGLASAFRIMSIPTLMFVKQGKIVGQSAGAAPEPALRDALEQLINLQIPA
jgi:thioredoxin 1